MRRLRISVLALGLTLGLAGCPTSFSGNAYVHDGRAGCEQKCKKAKLRMSALVFLGEYSSACVCEVPADKAKPAAPESAPAQPEAKEPSAEVRTPSTAVLVAGSLGGAVGALTQTVTAPDAPTPPLKW